MGLQPVKTVELSLALIPLNTDPYFRTATALEVHLATSKFEASVLEGGIGIRNGVSAVQNSQ